MFESIKRSGAGKGAGVSQRGRGSTARGRGGAAGCSAEPLEERVLMAMSLKVGGSGFSNVLATDSAALRQQKLIIDPPEPMAGSASTLYDATKVSLIAATPGPGYNNDAFDGFVQVRVNNVTRLQRLADFLQRPEGIETGYVQILYQLSGQAGKVDPPGGWILLDVGGTEGSDTHVLDFLRRENADGENNFRVFAAREGEFGGKEDFLITNDGTRTRLGPEQLSSAESTTAPKDGSISGTVFEDFNGNAERDGDDRGMEGVTVYVDLDEDKKPGRGEPTTQTNELGGYFFDDLDPGRYFVREVVPDGYTPTLGADGRSALVRPGERFRFANFGNVRGASVSGTVFNDLDNDGVRDAGEPGLAGAVVYLDLNNDGSFNNAAEPSATSAGPTGAWSISSLLPGTYSVRQIPPTGYVQTHPAGGSHVVTLSSGQSQSNLLFGDVLRPGPKVTGVFVRGSAWSNTFLKHLDTLRLGEAEAGLAIPLSGRIVSLLPWVNVNQVVVVFDKPVSVDAGNLLIDGVRADTAAASVAPLPGVSNAHVFTLRRSLGGDGSVRFNGDRLVLGLDGDAPDGVRATTAGGGLLMDGDDDGRPGGDFRLRFDVLQGDANRGRTVNVLDYASTRFRAGSVASLSSRYSLFHDVDGSGVIDATDAFLVRGRIGRVLPAVQAPAAAGALALAPPLRLASARRGLFADEPVAG